MRPPGMSRLDKLKEKAEAKGSVVLSKRYDPYNKMRFRCNEGHLWKARAVNINKGSWCPRCSGRIAGAKTKKPFPEVTAFAEDKGGQCLSKPTDYRNLASQLKWECSRGHKFTASLHNLRRRKHWCSRCRFY